MTGEATVELISEEMRGLIGKIQQRRRSYPISASDIRRWAIAIYYPDAPPAAYLRAGAVAGEPPLVAPEEFNPFAWAVADSDGGGGYGGPGFLELRAGIRPPAVRFIVNGGSQAEYGAPMREGDVITAEFGIRSYAQRQGKRGPLLITETEDRWTNQRDELVRSTIQTLVRY